MQQYTEYTPTQPGLITKYPGSSPPPLYSTNLTMWLHVLKSNMAETTWLLVVDETINKCEGNHHWCQWLPRYPSTIQWMWINEMNLNICGVIWSLVNDVNPLSEVRRPAIEAWKFQGTNGFRQIPGWCVEFDRKRLVKGGTWCIPHHWHKTDIDG